MIDSSDTPNYIDSTSTPLTFTHEVSSYLDFKYIDNDILNLLKSGSQWLGDVFDLETTYNYPFSFPQIGDSCHLKTKLVGKSSFVNTSFDISLYNQQKSIVISSTGGGYYHHLQQQRFELYHAQH